MRLTNFCRLFICCFIFLIIGTHQVQAWSKKDSVAVYYHSTDYPHWKLYPDTTLKLFFQQHPALSKISNSYLFYDLGNTGLPIYQLNNNLYKLQGFTMGRTASQLYCYDLGGVPIYETNHPFSELSYQTGQQGQTIISIIHVQPIGKLFHAQMNYRYLTSDGYFQLQKALHNNFHGQLAYQSKNLQYGASLSFLVNKLNWQENGGTVDDSAFIKSYINKNVVTVKMANTTQSFKQESIMAAYHFDFGEHYKIKLNDTTILPGFTPYFRLEHSFTSDGQYQHYSDKKFDSLNYVPFPIKMNEIDTFHRLDSLVGNWILHQYSNTLTFYILPIKKRINDSLSIKRKWVSQFAITHDYMVAKQTGINSKFQNLSIHAQLESAPDNWDNRYFVNLEGDYYASGYNHRDYKLYALFQPYWKLGNWYTGIILQAQRNHAPWLWQQLAFSNQFIKSELNPENKQFVKIYLGQFKQYFRLTWMHLWQQQLLYLDEKAFPQNYSASIYSQQLQFEKAIKIKQFHFQQMGTWFILRPSPLQLPKVALQLNWYYENYFFNKALLIQTGFNINWRSSFYAPNYSPLWNEFYYQKSRTFQQLPITDVYVSMKIKSARIFVKMENVFQGINTQANYTSYWYPMGERAFKVGVNWRFDDY